MLARSACRKGCSRSRLQVIHTKTDFSLTPLFGRVEVALELYNLPFLLSKASEEEVAETQEKLREFLIIIITHGLPTMHATKANKHRRREPGPAEFRVAGADASSHAQLRAHGREVTPELFGMRAGDGDRVSRCNTCSFRMYVMVLTLNSVVAVASSYPHCIPSGRPG